MKRRIIVNIYDDFMSIGDAIFFLERLKYDNLHFERNCLIEMTDRHIIYFDKSGKSLKVDISRKEPKIEGAKNERAKV